MSAREWLSLPWWEHNVLIEGMESEGFITLTQGNAASAAARNALVGERVHRDGGAVITESDYSYDLSEMDELPENGFSTGTLG